MRRGRILQRDRFSAKKAIQFSSFLQVLLDASEYSGDLAVSPWTFAVDYNQAQEFDINQNDIRWMIGKGWIRIDENHCEEDAAELIFAGEKSRFVISDQGIQVAKEILDDGRLSILQPDSTFYLQDSSGFQEKPCWDLDRRELLFHGELIKRFRWSAPNQETILRVFSEEGWPVKITDPLPPNSNGEPKRRLGDTIKCLNRNRSSNLVRFRGDGTGEGVIWEDLSQQTWQ